MKNEGKIFEQDFANSVDREKCWLYRFKDNASSFSGGTGTRFATSNICDYLMYHDLSKTLYLFELKSTSGTSIPYTMIRENQIVELTLASKHNLVAGFIFNFREKNNATYFMFIQDFNAMKEKLDKKSCNINDLEKYGAIKIDSEKKRTRSKYNIDTLIERTRQ